MNDFYVEHLVKKKLTWKNYALIAFLVLLTAFSFVLINIHIAFIVITLVLIGLTAFSYFCMNVEYEYFYMNGIFEIDRIEHRQKRRRVFEMRFDELEVLVPEGAFQVQPYRSVRIKDYSSRDKAAKRYEMVIGQYGRKRRIVLEPSELMLENMKKIEPKKIII